jgi:hypothetical protein
MKKIIIKNLDGVQTHGAEMEDPTQWIADCVAANVWGLPERPELDEMGNPTGNTLPAEYTVETVDVTAEYALKDIIAKRIAEYPSPEDYLNALFDGSPSIDDLKAKRLAIKAKYPKP